MAQYALEAGVSWLATSVSVVASGTWQFAKWTHKYVMQQAEELEADEPEESYFQQMVDKEKEFHNYVRQQIICMWLFMLLYLFAYWLISRLKRKTEREALYAGEEDYFVYRVSVWISSTATATSIGSLTLLPFSVIGVELLQLYDGNYYLQWLSYSLIGALWNYVFVLSNVSLFVLLPFSYFFIESQGFSTSKIGNDMTQRIYEAMAISFLFAFVLLCLAEVVLTILDYPVSFLSITSVNLPLIYSCVSFIGAVLLLISTPYGFAKMFSLARDFLVTEETADIEEENSEQSEDVTEPKNSSSDETIHQVDRSDTPHLEDVVNDITENVDADGEFRKDSDSGIESGSTEEMRLNTDDEEMGINDSDDKSAFGDDGDLGNSTPTKNKKKRRKHDYAATTPIVRKWDKDVPKKPKNPNFDYRNLKEYVKEARRQRSSLSESDDYWFGSPPRSSFSANYYSSRFSRWKHNSETGLNPSSSLLVDPFASGDFHEASSSEASSTPLSPARRTKSEEAIWKPVLHTVKSSKLYKRAIEKQGRLVKLFMSLRFPVAAAALLVLTTCSLIMVATNTLKLLFGYRSLPVYAQYIEVHTRHSFGLFGACIETLLIIYVMITSFVGLYSLPVLRSLRPVRKDTPMPTIIINSSIVLVVASALPVAVNTVGMTTFDLLGSHSSLQWLGSFRVVVAYNTLFVVLSVAFLFNQLTASMRRQIWKWICQLRCGIRRESDADETIEILRGDKKSN
ncbi:LIMR family protein R05D3.2 [Caenorhabditis elegans]|uniref:LMBR1 homolog n=1 Tax=Caenorhabditis elegans TaxID=6239 RepID=LMBR_CAEEL|nr:LIMR family protein R05D3.2 [Caenorhabditis elegans]P34535.1 RecName: Full=LIMR family protein R05D3.2 [Caenorhabditis elegans]CCD73188.1 LIMR family protein R05D3.2 [Caenorhabditis elegans]|eukprot:NP_498847.1 LIMR family protein R05D3.2 [Caenorhabditis elegans]